MGLSKYHSEYVREDEYSIYHAEDPDIPTIQVKLPSLESYFGLPWDEAIQKVDGYGLPVKDQHFENYRDKGFYLMPEKLQSLKEHVHTKLRKKPKEDVSVTELFDELESDPQGYADEMEWIETQQLRTENGHWIFIKGKPTYIDGTHYAYLQTWKIYNRRRKDTTPFYRDVDRKIFLFLRWAYTTKSSYFEYKMIYQDETGNIKTAFYNNLREAHQWALEQGFKNYMVQEWKQSVELDYRTVCGVIFPKRRRVGGTTIAAFFLLMITLQRQFAVFGIQALTEKSALQDVFQKKIMFSFERMWFFLKPAHSQHTTNKLVFIPEKSNFAHKDIEVHGGSVIPRSSDNKALDGLELTAYLNDESGKKKNSDILHEYTDTIKNALMYGNDIHGFAIYVSTLGKMDEGGAEFFEMCKRSMADKRGDNGQTQTGLVTLFIPAYEGYDRYIDIYGASIIDDPAEPYVNLEGDVQRFGARSQIIKHRRFLEKNKNKTALNASYRNDPFTLREASKRVSSGENWDLSVTDRVADLRFMPEMTRRVSLRWSDGLTLRGDQFREGRPFQEGLRVVVESDPNGRFCVSYVPPEEICNKYQWDEVAQSWVPTPMTMGRFVLGIDPFAFNTEDTTSPSKVLSKGAGVMVWNRDFVVDPEGKDALAWDSNRIILDYIERPDKPEEFAEDMLMASILYGAMALPETNSDVILRYWTQWGFRGYMIHLFNVKTGKLADVPGAKADHQLGFALVKSHLKAHGKRERHLRVLEQVEQVDNFSDVTKNDLFAALEMALIGAANPGTEGIKETAEAQMDFGGFLTLYD